MSVNGQYLPADCTFSKNDWNIFASFWHPVALCEEVTDKPIATTLLDEPLVIFRTQYGVTVAKNMCPHRGMRLDMGWIDSDKIVCPYHGLNFSSDGTCAYIPGAGPNAIISEKLCLVTYATVERYGLIWVCLNSKPRYPLPDWPAMEDNKMQKYLITEDWNIFAGRHSENFNDTAHIPWVHAGTFGVREEPLTEIYKTEEKDYGFYIHTHVTATAGNTREHIGENTTVTNEYFFTFPFASEMKMTYDFGEEYAFHVASPLTKDKSRIFFLGARNYDLDKPVSEWVEFFAAANNEDRGICENQKPQEIILDLTREFHLPFDSFSIAYRRKWKEFGLKGDR